ncbi:MAG TPA: hypothetical protein VHF27_11370 [Acidimicrobiales bacterium]|nr:hypothetical protein [Acidimicrobiales bacterium]
MLQSEAAARTGFSVSAIRKWRRMGVVADRKVTSGTGLERVEVKLEDVLARAAQQADRRPAEDGGVPAGSVVITLEDLEALFERMVSAERRAEEAETAAEALRAQATFTFGQLAELRRQLQEAAEDHPRPRDRRAAAAPVATLVPPSRPAERPRPSSAPPPEPAPALSAVEELGERLRRIYARLDEYRRHPVLTSEAERRQQQDLAEYDRVLVAVCDAMGIDTGLLPAQRIGAEERAALTRALARAGLDVRTGMGAHGSRRPRTPIKRRF